MLYGRLLDSDNAKDISCVVADLAERQHFYRDGLVAALEEAAFGLSVERAVDEMENVLWSFKLGDMSDPCDEWPVRVVR